MALSRLDFLKQMGLFSGAVVLPSLPVKEIVVYDKLYLLHSFVRGFKYYEGPKILSEMKEGDQVELVREPDNEYDPDAVALHWNRKKIGFIPAESNDILSKLLDIGFPEFGAEITHLDPKAATWENVAIAVSVLRPRPADEELPEHVAAYQVLNTPHYNSFKLGNNQVARVYWDDDDDGGMEYVIDRLPEKSRHKTKDDNWYTFLEEHSRNDGIYDMIHSNLTGAETYGNGSHTYAFKRDEIIRMQKDLPEEILQALNYADSRVKGLEDYVLLKSNQVEELIPRLIDLAEVEDNFGNRFIKLIVG